MLWATAQSARVFAEEESRQRWHERILSERSQRITRYRERMTGPGSLWLVVCLQMGARPSDRRIGQRPDPAQQPRQIAALGACAVAVPIAVLAELAPKAASLLGRALERGRLAT